MIPVTRLRWSSKSLDYKDFTYKSLFLKDLAKDTL
jgi:hypothetical protein